MPKDNRDSLDRESDQILAELNMEFAKTHTEKLQGSHLLKTPDSNSRYSIGSPFKTANPQVLRYMQNGIRKRETVSVST